MKTEFCPVLLMACILALFTALAWAMVVGAESGDGIACIGDSITSTPGGYADQLDADKYVWYHLADSITLIDTLPHNYEVIVIELGSHAVHGSDRLLAADSENLFRYYYDRLLDKVQQHAKTVIVLTIPWREWGPENRDLAQRYNRIIIQVAAKHSAEVVDAWSILEGCGLTCIGEDTVHPNATGHGLLIDALRDKIR